MDQYRAIARESLKSVSDDVNYTINAPNIESNIKLEELWDEISRDDSTETADEICENLLLIEAVLRNLNHDELQKNDREAARSLIFWTADFILPTAEFAAVWGDSQLADDGDLKSILSKHKAARLKSTVGISVLQLLNSISPITQIDPDEVVDIITALAAYTCKTDPWTTEQAFNKATSILGDYELSLRSSNDGGALATLLGEILKIKVKPLFARTKTPALTAAGRKNVHPLPQVRFDPSIFDPESKPWKFRDVYVVTVLGWIVGRYLPTDKQTIESHLPLLIPAILSLIDDESLPFKTKGCTLLTTFLAPLEESKSDILARTNLDSVFQDAITPCLLSLPTITPENESIHLLKSAYPALLAVIRTRFPTSQEQTQTQTQPPPTKAKANNDSAKRQKSLTTLLRHSLLHSYSHTSHPHPHPTSSISAYPYPHLSTLLLTQLPPLLTELGIHTTKHLQDLVPMLSATLANPFGTAYPPLLEAAVEAMRCVVVNGWVRVGRWRGEVMDGVCACWVHVLEDGEGEMMGGLKEGLKRVVGVLRVVVQEGEGDVVDIDREFAELVRADERLGGLLVGNEYF
ncbi:hypothetical protein FQN50_005116 [Emmonsiellopsis sp. PD_5]|nr:hypothetical protein FQN50_005116 [Emmonsiellopsis sp. PD_5]